MPKRRSVKSEPSKAPDAHERAKNFLSATEIDELLAAAKLGRHGVRDHLILLFSHQFSTVS